MDSCGFVPVPRAGSISPGENDRPPHSLGFCGAGPTSRCLLAVKSRGHGIEKKRSRTAEPC